MESGPPSSTADRAAQEANRETLRRAFEARQAGTSPLADVFAEEMVWRIEGHSAASKE
jgi:uncharacterized protein